MPPCTACACTEIQFLLKPPREDPHIVHALQLCAGDLSTLPISTHHIVEYCSIDLPYKSKSLSHTLTRQEVVVG